MLFSWASDTPLLLFGPPLSFFLSQDDINEAADEAEREGHPGQHVGEAELNAGLFVWTHHGVDDGRAHHKHACGRDQRIGGMRRRGVRRRARGEGVGDTHWPGSGRWR